MSWLQGLAGKAEGLLNRMDQTAAVTLHTGSTEQLHVYGHGSSSADAPVGPEGWNTLHRMRRSGSNSSTVSDFTDGTGRQQSHTYPIDETSEDAQQNAIRRTASHQNFERIATTKHQRTGSTKKTDDYFADMSTSSPGPATTHGLTASSAIPNEPSALEATFTRTTSEVVGEEVTENFRNVTDSGSEAVLRENKLMKSELQGQSRELSMALGRVKRAEQDTQKLLNQLATERQKFAAENDTRERDFLVALSSKDAQATGMRQTLEQVEKAWKAAEARLTEAKRQLKNYEHLDSSQNDRELENHENARRLADAEALLQKEKDHAAEQINRLKNLLRTLEGQTRDDAAAISNLERLRATDHGMADDLRRQLSLMSSECEVAHREFSEYKQKALKILQSKDELINSLKSGSGILSDEIATLESTEIEEERDMLREEVVKLRDVTDSFAQQISQREVQHKRDCADLRDLCNKAEQTVIVERDRCRDIEATIQSYVDEINYIRSETTRKEQSLQQRLKDRDNDLQRMRQQLLTRSESRPVDGELEARMRVLTENLIQKQSLIETLNTEHHAMTVQIERLEKRLREAARSTYEESRIPVPTDSADHNVNGRGTSFLTENSSDNKVARHLKKAYSTVDKFSFRLGIFLRRYPLARIMVIAYMFLLHFWVLVVLLTYTPETHGHDSPVKK